MLREKFIQQFSFNFFINLIPEEFNFIFTCQFLEKKE